MKVGFFGGLLLLGLTIIFSLIAIENNKIAREITIRNFGLDKSKEQIVNDTNDTNRSKTQIQKSDFDRKFEEFDKKLLNF